MGEVIRFPTELVDELAGCFRAFDDRVKCEVVILPVVRIERDQPLPRRRRSLLKEPA